MHQILLERLNAGSLTLRVPRRYDPAVIQEAAGWVDTLTISPDGNSLDGSNQHGTHVFAQRLASKPIAPAKLCELVEDALMRE